VILRRLQRSEAMYMGPRGWHFALCDSVAFVRQRPSASSSIHLSPAAICRSLCRFSTRVHRSKIMLSVLVVVFCSDYIARLGLGLG
jgi:hypothetical protein